MGSLWAEEAKGRRGESERNEKDTYKEQQCDTTQQPYIVITQTRNSLQHSLLEKCLIQGPSDSFLERNVTENRAEKVEGRMHARLTST